MGNVSFFCINRFCKVMNENARDEESARRPLLGQANGNGSSGDYDAVGMPTQTVGRNREDSQVRGWMIVI